MVTLSEKELEFTFTNAVSALKFDEPATHGTNAMKAVDFIVEFPSYELFVEVKDPDISTATVDDHARFAQKLGSGVMEASLKYKYRDSFLYRWACGKIKKPIKYAVLLEMSSLRPRDYQLWTDKLKRVVPLVGPTSWSKPIVHDIWVLNMATWNRIGQFGSVRRV